VNDSGHSIPLIRLFDNLVVSVQVALSDTMVERLSEDVTRTIEETQVSGLILDFSGADVLDSHVTRRVRDLAVTARFMGVDTVVCGLRRSVVIALVEMGLGVPGVLTALNLERALEMLVQRRHASRAAAAADDADQADSEGQPALAARGPRGALR
jgi:rsbT antagonist protein RsbS